jgi:hypothetical protein
MIVLTGKTYKDYDVKNDADKHNLGNYACFYRTLMRIDKVEPYLADSESNKCGFQSK